MSNSSVLALTWLQICCSCWSWLMLVSFSWWSMLSCGNKILLVSEQTQGSPHDALHHFSLYIWDIYKFSGLSRLKNDVISKSSVLSWLDCAIGCLGKRFCAAFNFKENSNKNEINCQLSHKAEHKFKRRSAEDNDWTLYEVYGERIVREF